MDVDLPVEQPGEAAKRNQSAYNQRRHRSAVRGLGSMANFTAQWLASAPENEEYFINQEAQELALAVTGRAVQAAIDEVEEELERERRAQHALYMSTQRKGSCSQYEQQKHVPG